MDLEMVLNELSLQTPAPDIPTARERMSELIQTLRRATASGVKRILRTNININSLELAPGYPVAQWRKDPKSDREERRFFRTLTAKAPFWEDAAEEIKDELELSEVFYREILDFYYPQERGKEEKLKQTVAKLEKVLGEVLARNGMTEDEFADLFDMNKPFPYDETNS